MLDLRPYQHDAIAAVNEGLERGIARPLIGLPTGTGKTVVFAHLIKQRRDMGQALVIAHRDELLQQAEDKIKTVIPDAMVGQVKGDRQESDLPIVVASIQTISRQKRLDKFPKQWATVIIDEAHHSAADSYMRVIEALDSPLMLGVTATPERGDGKPLGGAWQDLVYQRGILEMMQQGYLCEIRAKAIELDIDMTKFRTSHGDFVDSETSQALTEANAHEAAVRAYKKFAPGRKTIVFTPTVELARVMRDEFRDGGIKATWVHGEMDIEERRERIQQFRAGHVDVICNCAILTEGFDEPSIGCIIIARPTKSRPLYIQMIGRGTRLYPGKKDLLVLDLVGNTNRLDLVTVPNLFGLMPDEVEAEGVLAAEGYRHDREEEAAAVEKLKARDVELFKRNSIRWVDLELDEQTWALTLGSDGFLAIEHEDGYGYSVTRFPRYGDVEEIASGVDVGYAQGIAEDLVRQEGVEKLVDPEARWRKKNLSEYPNMIRALGKFKIDLPGETKAGDASDMLSKAIARSTIKRHRAIRF